MSDSSVTNSKLLATGPESTTQPHPLNFFRDAVDSFSSCSMFYPVIGLLCSIASVAILIVIQYFSKLDAFFYLVLQGVSIGLCIYFLVVLLIRVRKNLLVPIAHLREWTNLIRSGNLKAQIPVPDSGQFASLLEDINGLGEAISQLSSEVDQESIKQTERIAQKNHSLEVLYDVAASINISRNLEDLLQRFLRTLKEVVNARAVTVRLMSDDGQMRLAGSLGLEGKETETAMRLPVLHCMYASKMQEGELLSKDKVLRCEKYPGQPFYNDAKIEMIAVPLQYQGNNLGVYNLFVKKPSLLDREDTKDLLISIGRHLGVAIEKAYIDKEAKRLSIVRERNRLSHELHDSLAQTLASLRFQVRTLDDSLQHQAYQAAAKEVFQIRNGLDEAYTELRELLAHFRAPVDEKGLVNSINKTISKFREQSDILIFFQNQWKIQKLAPYIELQVLRIIQEALNNVRKYSQAHVVRVLLRSDEQGNQIVLIEDDGVGIGGPILDGNPGEHLGLSIMRERAHRIGGKLQIESEAGEGTRIMLTFHPNEQEQRDLLEML